MIIISDVNRNWILSINPCQIWISRNIWPPSADKRIRTLYRRSTDI